MKEYEYEAKAMGCTVSATIVSEDATAANAAWERMYDTIRAYDMRFSRFNPESELSRLNAARTMQVSREMREVIMLGKELYRKTDGVFTMLADVSRFGYDEDIAVVRNRARTGNTNAYDTDASSIMIDGDTVKLREGQTIDVGGFLKGYLAECLAKDAIEFPGVVINLGGDLYTRGVNAYGELFELAIEKPNGEEIRFTARDEAVATSGTYRRRWRYNGAPMHHILRADGHGNPVTDLISATVIAPHGADAEAYSTASIVLGSVRAKKLLESQGLEYAFVKRDGTVVSSKHFSAALPSYAG